MCLPASPVQVHTQVNKQGSTFVVTIDVDGSLAPGSEELHVSW